MAKARITKKPVGRVEAPARVYSPSKGKALDINYKISDDLGISYADQFIVQFYPDEFVISFFQSAHPLIFSDEEFSKLDALEARCIARFALNPPQMRRFFQALEHNIKRWGEANFPDELRRKLETTE